MSKNKWFVLIIILCAFGVSILVLRMNFYRYYVNTTHTNTLCLESVNVTDDGVHLTGDIATSADGFKGYSYVVNGSDLIICPYYSFGGVGRFNIDIKNDMKTTNKIYFQGMENSDRNLIWQRTSNTYGKKLFIIKDWQFLRVAKESDDKYLVFLYDSDKNIVHEEVFSKEPIVESLKDDIIKITIIVGSPAYYTTFYDPKTKRYSSDAIFNLLSYFNEKGVYAEEGKLIICNVFDKKKYYQEITRNFSPTAVYSSDFTEIKFMDENKLFVKYLVGNNYTEKEEVIDIF